jgi:excisionase family DNA binding protein
MARDSKRPPKYVPRPEETQTLVRKELRRRGVSEEKIVSTLRKKKRRKVLEFALVQSRHAIPREKISARGKADKADAPELRRPRLADELCTVEFAAARLKVHQKTILRFIRKGRLHATRIGKSYRILRSDLEALAGVAMPAAAPPDAYVTSIVDIPDVAPETAQQWSVTVTNALNARANRTPPLRAETIYEPDRAHFRVVIVGAPGDTANLLGLIRMWTERQ